VSYFFIVLLSLTAQAQDKFLSDEEAHNLYGSGSTTVRTFPIGSEFTFPEKNPNFVIHEGHSCADTFFYVLGFGCRVCLVRADATVHISVSGTLKLESVDKNEGGFPGYFALTLEGKKELTCHSGGKKINLNPNAVAFAEALKKHGIKVKFSAPLSGNPTPSATPNTPVPPKSASPPMH
jgi:hypothetical protein